MNRGSAVAKQHGIKRSPHWPAARRKWIRKHPFCSMCAGAKKPQVHHLFPFHFAIALGRPDLELDERNFMTLCEVRGTDHHLKGGHLGSFELWNPALVGLPASSTVKPLGQMTNAEKDRMRKAMNRIFPL